MRTLLTVLAAALLVTVGSAELAGAQDGRGRESGPPPTEHRCSRQSRRSIQYSMAQFLTAPTVGRKVAYVENGAALRAVLVLSSTAAQQEGLTRAGLTAIPVGLKIQCTGAATADFTFDLQLKERTTGTTQGPLGLHLQGDAVLKRGHWLISPATVCDLTQMESLTFGTQCYEAAGLPVPPPIT